VADSGRFGSWPPAAQVAGTPRGAGISGKKKGSETIRALVYGGGWFITQELSIRIQAC